MKTVPLNSVFKVEYGSKFDFNKMELCDRGDGGVAFVGRASFNHGVSGYVRRVEGVEPYAAGQITVALGGSKLLSSFVQEDPFYTAQNVAVLSPLAPMDFKTKVYYCLCIKANRFRYSAFGREANRTLRTLDVPSRDDLPSLAEQADTFNAAALVAPSRPDAEFALETESWRAAALGELFDIKKGKRIRKIDMTPGATPFIGAIDKRNGVSAYIGSAPLHQGNVLTLNYNGSVGECFYQPTPFWCSDDVNILVPRGFTLTPPRALFLCALIKRERYRYNYGRKWHTERMGATTIKLPHRGNVVDWEWVDRFTKTLRYSGGIEMVTAADEANRQTA